MKHAFAALAAAATLMSVTFSLSSDARAADAGSPKFFAPDAPGMPAYALPDTLTAADGRKITTADEWRKIRRQEILELFRQHVYGRVPATPYEKRFKVVNEDPGAMGGAATLKQVEITITAAGKSLTIPLTLFVPNKAPKPVPAFLLICNRSRDDIDPTREKKSDFWPAEAVIARGYAVAAFYNGDVAPDRKDSFNEGIHGLLDRVRPADAWGTLAAWAWGASRCLDYLETDKDIRARQGCRDWPLAGRKNGALGGRRGRAVRHGLLERFGLRRGRTQPAENAQKETVAKINRAFPHWFDENFRLYNDREDKLPVDQHMLIALIAPRAVCVASAEDDLWADPRGEFLSAVHAGPVYRLFGKQGLGDSSEMPAIGSPLHGDGVHYHIREGKHDLTLFDWNCYMDFADRVFGRRGKQITNSIGMKLTLIPSGTFMMGSGESEEETTAFFKKNYGMTFLHAGFLTDEHPQHRVRITKSFYLGTYHVTRGQFQQFINDSGYRKKLANGDKLGVSGSFTQTDDHPVVEVSWNDAVAFCEWLSKKEGKTYRLPTEAEWEYCCRAGTTTRFYSGDDPETLASVANVADATFEAKFADVAFFGIKASDGYAFTSPVGRFKPNAFGLYDMHGNAWQWCADWYDFYYYSKSPVRDPKGPDCGNARVRRGGSWFDWAALARSAVRSKDLPDSRDYCIGFRVARTQ